MSRTARKALCLEFGMYAPDMLVCSAGVLAGVVLESCLAPVLPALAGSGLVGIASLLVAMSVRTPLFLSWGSAKQKKSVKLPESLKPEKHVSWHPDVTPPTPKKVGTTPASGLSWWLQGCCCLGGRQADEEDEAVIPIARAAATRAVATPVAAAAPACCPDLDPELCLVRADERAAIEALKDSLASELQLLPQWEDLVGERCLLRFYRGHGTVPKAAEAYRKMLQWRVEHSADDLRSVVANLPWAMEAVPGMDQVAQVFPIDIAAGQSPEGHTVWIERSGCLDLNKFKSISDKDFSRTWGGLMELRTRHLDDRSKAQQRLVKVVQIRDLRGFNASLYLSLVSSGVIKRLQNIIVGSMAAHPESIHKVVMLNMPRAFNSVWALMKPLLTDRMRKKFYFLSHPHDPRALCEVVGAEALLSLAKLSAPTSPCPGAADAKVASEDFLELALRVPAGKQVRWHFSASAELELSILEMPEAACRADTVRDILSPKSMSTGEGRHTPTRDVVCLFRWLNKGGAWSSSRTLSYNVDLV